VARKVEIQIDESIVISYFVWQYGHLKMTIDSLCAHG